jgi:large subunit ribosomal protein L19
MSAPARPLAALKSALRQLRADKHHSRCYVTATAATIPGRPVNFHPGAIMTGRSTTPPLPIHSLARTTCKDPIAALTATQITTLDPSGARTRLFSRENVDRANVGDILLVRLKNGDQYAGVCLNIRHQGIDTAILLRNNLTRVGVEMWYKIYSPNVEGVEVVQRKEKRARRARLYYMRLPRHDIGSVDNIVRQYQRQRAMLRSSEVKSRDSNSRKKKNNKRG